MKMASAVPASEGSATLGGPRVIGATPAGGEVVHAGHKVPLSAPMLPVSAPTFEVGDKVRLKASVDRPKYGWGYRIDQGLVGVVTSLTGGGPEGEAMVVAFPGSAGWAADPSEMELVKTAEPTGNAVAPPAYEMRLAGKVESRKDTRPRPERTCQGHLHVSRAQPIDGQKAYLLDLSPPVIGLRYLYVVPDRGADLDSMVGQYVKLRGPLVYRIDRRAYVMQVTKAGPADRGPAVTPPRSGDQATEPPPPPSTESITPPTAVAQADDQPKQKQQQPAATLVTRDRVRLTLAGAEAILAAARARAAELKVRVNVAIVDDGGHLLAFVRIDGARPGSIYTAITKAFTAATMRAATGPLPNAKEPDLLLNLSLQNAALAGGGRLTTLHGGVPIEVDGQVIGAVGCGGATGEQDADVARAGVRALLELMKQKTK
jgi:glc operon protein GlcG